MEKDRYQIGVFLDKEGITFVPCIFVRNVEISYIHPIHKIQSEEIDATKIGNEIILIGSYINSLFLDKVDWEGIDPDELPRMIGYSSWTRMKKSVQYVDVYWNADVDSESYGFKPMVPVGRGFRFDVRKIDNRAGTDDPLGIGQALLVALDTLGKKSS